MFPPDGRLIIWGLDDHYKKPMPIIEGGYLTVPRRVLRLLVSLSDPPLLSLFFHLLEKARLQAGVFHGVRLERGQYLTGRQVLALTLRMSEKEIRNRFAKLSELELIAVTTTNKFTIVTITNYETYSGPGNVELIGANKNGKKGQPEGQQKGQQNFTVNNSITGTYGDGTGEKGQQKGQLTGQPKSEKGPLLDQVSEEEEEYIDILAYSERSRVFKNVGSRESDVTAPLPAELQEKQRKFFARAMEVYPAGCRGFTTEWAEFKRTCPDWIEVVFYLPAAIERYKTHLESRQRKEGFAPAWPSFRKFLSDRYFETELLKAVEKWNSKYREAGREEFVLPAPTFLS